MNSRNPSGEPKGGIQADAEAGAEAKRFAKKVPQTSVAPTYKLTLPAEYVQLHLSHLIDQDFEVTDHSGSRYWDVTILPRRNKDKYEYTLQGWKPFAESSGVQAGDRLEFDLLSESRLQIRVVRRAQYKERSVPPENPLHQGLDTYRDNEGNTLSDGTDQGSSDLQTPATGGFGAGPSGLTRAGGSGVSVDTPHHGGGPLALLGGTGGNLTSSSLGLALQNQLLDLRPVTFDMDPGSRRASVAREHLGALSSLAQGQVSQLGMLGPPASGLLGGWGLPFGQEMDASSKRQRQESQDVSRGHRTSAAIPDWPARGEGPPSPLVRKSVGMRLLSSAAEKDSHGITGDVGDLQERLEHASTRAKRAEMEAATMVEVVGTMEGVLEQQTSRGLATVGALLHIANRLINPDLLSFVDQSVAQELASIQAELKHHTDTVLEAMWHMRNLTKQGHQSNIR